MPAHKIAVPPTASRFLPNRSANAPDGTAQQAGHKVEDRVYESDLGGGDSEPLGIQRHHRQPDGYGEITGEGEQAADGQKRAEGTLRSGGGRFHTFVFLRFGLFEMPDTHPPPVNATKPSSPCGSAPADSVVRPAVRREAVSKSPAAISCPACKSVIVTLATARSDVSFQFSQIKSVGVRCHRKKNGCGRHFRRIDQSILAEAVSRR